MRSLTVAAFFFLFAIYNNPVSAQHAPRPHLFDDYAATLDFPQSELEKVFTELQGNAIKLTLSGSEFTGVIGTSKQTYSNLQNVVVKLANLQGAILHVSKIINADNTISYTGRMINEKFADGYELKNNAGSYILKKIKTDDVIID